VAGGYAYAVFARRASRGGQREEIQENERLMDAAAARFPGFPPAATCPPKAGASRTRRLSGRTLGVGRVCRIEQRQKIRVIRVIRGLSFLSVLCAFCVRS
jgi:hypothetical protein